MHIVMQLLQVEVQLQTASSPFLDSQEGAQNTCAKKPKPGANVQRGDGGKGKERDCTLSCN